ncbi:hypothetical protein B7P43_G06929 [Cryptotermes secundus]|uniref:Uncharacterized protein n=1 Tax=Cryptotermes secundus TaxID=105785 RepID=A0A2J7PNY8_9NEOP|nr:uncharacterized protein LOC111872705 [Cryptotermes secundus]XP_033610694.1 uncharacterized protein LOC111872705 [Cryptotermes secundus]PNF18053.1 hypothetical protein B7P43_G06929 [Cryptotermes secundus]
MSLINQTIKEEQFILEDESHEDHVKELDGMQYIKQEPFSSLDENDNEPSNISGLERKQSLVMEQACDIEMKSEPLLEESKPVIKEQVAIAPFTPQEGVALPAAWTLHIYISWREGVPSFKPLGSTLSHGLWKALLMTMLGEPWCKVTLIFSGKN